MSPQALGTWLVALQFAAMAWVAWAAWPAVHSGSVPLGAWAVAAAGVLLGLWAVTCNRPGNFNIRPMPRADGQLVQSGPYRWIRHPMYSAVLLGAAACVWAARSPGAWAAFAILAAVLATKARLEERWMTDRHPGYARYQQRTRRFVPGLF